MIAPQYKHIFRGMATDNINILINGIGCTTIPTSVDTLLSRNNFDKFANLSAHKTPGALQVAN